MDLKETRFEVVDSFGSRHRIVSGTCEHCNKFSGFMKDREIYD
jgi:hypothetical protein